MANMKTLIGEPYGGSWSKLAEQTRRVRKLAAFLAVSVGCMAAHASTLVLECDATGNSHGIGTNVKIPATCANYTIECWMKPIETVASGQYNLLLKVAYGSVMC